MKNKKSFILILSVVLLCVPFLVYSQQAEQINSGWDVPQSQAPSFGTGNYPLALPVGIHTHQSTATISQTTIQTVVTRGSSQTTSSSSSWQVWGTKTYLYDPFSPLCETTITPDYWTNQDVTAHTTRTLCDDRCLVSPEACGDTYEDPDLLSGCDPETFTSVTLTDYLETANATATDRVGNPQSTCEDSPGALIDRLPPTLGPLSLEHVGLELPVTPVSLSQENPTPYRAHNGQIDLLFRVEDASEDDKNGKSDINFHNRAAGSARALVDQKNEEIAAIEDAIDQTAAERKESAEAIPRQIAYIKERSDLNKEALELYAENADQIVEWEDYVSSRQTEIQLLNQQIALRQDLIDNPPSTERRNGVVGSLNTGITEVTNYRNGLQADNNALNQEIVSLESQITNNENQFVALMNPIIANPEDPGDEDLVIASLHEETVNLYWTDIVQRKGGIETNDLSIAIANGDLLYLDDDTTSLKELTDEKEAYLSDETELEDQIESKQNRIDVLNQEINEFVLPSEEIALKEAQNSGILNDVDRRREKMIDFQEFMALRELTVNNRRSDILVDLEAIAVLRAEIEEINAGDSTPLNEANITKLRIKRVADGYEEYFADEESVYINYENAPDYRWNINIHPFSEEGAAPTIFEKSGLYELELFVYDRASNELSSGNFYIQIFPGDVDEDTSMIFNSTCATDLQLANNEDSCAAQIELQDEYENPLAIRPGIVTTIEGQNTEGTYSVMENNDQSFRNGLRFALSGEGTAEGGGQEVGGQSCTPQLSQAENWRGQVSEVDFTAPGVIEKVGSSGHIEIGLTTQFDGNFSVEWMEESTGFANHVGVYDASEDAQYFNENNTSDELYSLNKSWFLWGGQSRIQSGSSTVGTYTKSDNANYKLERVDGMFSVYQNGTLLYTWSQKFSGPVRLGYGGPSPSGGSRVTNFRWTDLGVCETGKSCALQSSTASEWGGATGNASFDGAGFTLSPSPNDVVVWRTTPFAGDFTVTWVHTIFNDNTNDWGLIPESKYNITYNGASGLYPDPSGRIIENGNAFALHSHPSYTTLFGGEPNNNTQFLTNVSDPSSGDTLALRRTGSIIEYLHNGTVVYTWTQSSLAPLYLAFAFGNGGEFTVDNMSWTSGCDGGIGDVPAVVPSAPGECALTYQEEEIIEIVTNESGEEIEIPKTRRWQECLWDTNEGGQGQIGLKALIPSGSLIGNRDRATLFKPETKTTAFGFDVPNVDKEGSILPTKKYITLFDNINFDAWVKLFLSDNPGNIEPTNPLQFLIGAMQTVYEYTTTQTPDNLPDDFDIHLRGHSPAGTIFKDEDLSEEAGIKRDFIGIGNTHENNVSTHLQARGGVLKDIGVSFSSVVDYFIDEDANPTTPEDLRHILYPGGNLGNNVGGEPLFDRTEMEGAIGADNTDISAIIVGADVEGQVLTQGENFTYQETGGVDDARVLRMGNVTAADVREEITRNAYQIIRGSVPNESGVQRVFDVTNFEDGGVTYFKGGIVQIGDPLSDLSVSSGKHTIVIEDGNLFVAGNFTYASPHDSLGIILINTTTGVKPDTGNIFILNNVKHFVGTYYADGSLTSTTKLSSHFIADEVNREDTSILGNQLLLEGTLLTKNTLGGGMLEPLINPWGLEQERAYAEAQKYDLHFVRRYMPPKPQVDPETGESVPVEDADNDKCVKLDPKTCDPNKHAFVIRPDRRVSEVPPPGFTGF